MSDQQVKRWRPTPHSGEVVSAADYDRTDAELRKERSARVEAERERDALAIRATRLERDLQDKADHVAVLEFDLARARERCERLEAKLRECANTCEGCGGKGWYYVGEYISGRGPDDVFPEQEHCPECADIRELLPGGKG